MKTLWPVRTSFRRKNAFPWAGHSRAGCLSAPDSAGAVAPPESKLSRLLTTSPCAIAATSATPAAVRACPRTAAPIRSGSPSHRILPSALSCITSTTAIICRLRTGSLPMTVCSSTGFRSRTTPVLSDKRNAIWLCTWSGGRERKGSGDPCAMGERQSEGASQYHDFKFC